MLGRADVLSREVCPTLLGFPTQHRVRTLTPRECSAASKPSTSGCGLLGGSVASAQSATCGYATWCAQASPVRLRSSPKSPAWQNVLDGRQVGGGRPAKAREDGQR